MESSVLSQRGFLTHMGVVEFRSPTAGSIFQLRLCSPSFHVVSGYVFWLVWWRRMEVLFFNPGLVSRQHKKGGRTKQFEAHYLAWCV